MVTFVVAVGWALSPSTDQQLTPTDEQQSARSQGQPTSDAAIARVEHQISAIRKRLTKAIEPSYGEDAAAESALLRETKLLLRSINRASREGKSHN